MGVTRGDFSALVDVLNDRAEILNQAVKGIDIQFSRVAQI